MKKSFYSCATLTLLVGLASFGFAQTPTAIIKIEGYSPQEIHDLGWTSPRSTGLSNVGVNQLVYLVGNKDATTWQWALTSKPTGSNAVLDSTDKMQTTFKPDVVGKFTVELVVTTAGGASAPVSVTINAAKFVGVGGMDGLPTDVAAGQCALCHSTNFNQWTKTGHSDMLKRGLNGILSPNYNENCIECHTTGYDHDANGNDGFDDVQAEVGWKFPTTLKAGNYDTLLMKYPKLAHRANIQCESCHGPGSAHKGDKSGIAMSLDEAACGYCHNVVYNATANTCAGSYCHGNWGLLKSQSQYAFIYTADKMEGINAAPKWTDSASAACGTCHGNPPVGHQPHDLTRCFVCHAGVVDENGKIADKTKHINGKVNAFGQEYPMF